MSVELPICEGGLGWVYGCSRRGPMHIQNNLPCQDAYGTATGAVAGSPYIAVAVADGHGDAAHDLSQFGAALAVHVAIDELRAFYRHFGENRSVSSLRRNFDEIPRLVGKRWRNAVLTDATERRITELPAPANSPQLWTRYGTTLLVALIVPGAILLGQIGDGDIIFLRADGTVESPIKKDPSLVGMATNSLCSSDATQFWQTAILRPEQGGLLLLATDGLSNAFADEDQFHNFAWKLVERIKEFGMESVAASIPQWLDEKYSQASGDDIALTLVNVKSHEPEMPPATHQDKDMQSQAFTEGGSDVA